MALKTGTRLGQYEIVKPIGAGGMGEVYAARDTRLERTVALKLLPPLLTRDATAKARFIQEAKAASGLDHPNICTIYDIGEADDGQLFLAMAHYGGGTLREKIERGPLALDEALDIAVQVAQGLAKAHASGITHRDIKPANIMLTTDGIVKVVDFGLAKLAGHSGLTETGTTLGTIAYMPPEQVQGESVDPRADIWSLGVVLYEMVTGQRPFTGEHQLVIANAIQQQTPKALTSIRSGVPLDLERVVGRMLAKAVADRYQTSIDLLSELRLARRDSAAMSAASGSVAGPGDSTHLAAAVPTSASSAVAPTSDSGRIPSVGVLAFSNMSADPKQEYFCDGLAEELIDALAKLDGLRVASRTSAFQFKGQSLDIRKVGEQLNVGAVLEGSVRKVGNRLRITAQLINVGDGYHLWSERYDRTMDDIFAVQEEIARAIVEKLKVKLVGEASTQLVKRPTDNVEAYNLLLKGRHQLYRLTAEAIAKAGELFAQAIALEPGYAEAHARLSMARSAPVILGWEAPAGAMPEIRKTVLKALALDDACAEARYAYAWCLHWYDWDWAGAEREYRQAIELDPVNSDCRADFALLLVHLGRFDEAIVEARRALDLDPLAPNVYLRLSEALSYAKRYDEAMEVCRRGVEVDPTAFSIYYYAGNAPLWKGDARQAVAEFERGRRYSQGDPLLEGRLGAAYGFAGMLDEARAVLEALRRRRKEGYLSAHAIAWVYLGLGEHEEALEWLATGVEERDPMCLFMKVLPDFDPLRGDPRFQKLVETVFGPSD